MARILVASGRDIEIPYALRAGTIVHVSEVARGLDCCCICARCGEALVARKGTHRQHHFAHFRESDCSGAAESLLHRLAKELLSRAKTLALPACVYRATVELRYDAPVPFERTILAASHMCITSVAVEQSVGPIVPDLLLRSGEAILILEIAVSHSVDRAKLRHIRRTNIPALELSLTAADLLLSRTELSRRLIEDTSIKSWLFHPAQRSAEEEWIKARRGARTRASDLPVASIPERPRARQQDNSDWRRYNEWAEQFFRRHRRYPTIEETQAFERNKRGR